MIRSMLAWLFIALSSVACNVCVYGYWHSSFLFTKVRYPYKYIYVYEEKRRTVLSDAIARNLLSIGNWQCWAVPKVNMQGQESLNIGIGCNTFDNSGWVEASELSLLPSEWYQPYFDSIDFSKITERSSIGGGFGWKLNTLHALKLYSYYDASSVALSARNYMHKTLTGGIEIQSLRYRMSLNIRKNILVKQGAEKDYPNRLTTPRSLMSIPGYNELYKDLFLKMPLLEQGHFGCSTQIEWYYKNISPYLGAYCNRVNFLIPKAGLYSVRDHSVAFGVSKKHYDYSFSKYVLGLSFGCNLPLGHMQLGLQGNVDNSHGWQGSISLALPLVANKIRFRNASANLLSYRAPMRYAGPTSYTRTISAKTWSRPSDPKAKWISPIRVRGLNIHYNKIRTIPHLTINEIAASWRLMKKMSEVHYQADYDASDNTNHFKSISPSYLESYFNRYQRLEESASNVSHALEELTGRLNDMHFECLPRIMTESNPSLLKKLTQDTTRAQLRGLQFLVNAARLFHTLEPRSALLIIHLSKSHGNFLKLPTELRIKIAKYLLLDSKHTDAVLDRRYKSNKDPLTMVSTIMNAL